MYVKSNTTAMHGIQQKNKSNSEYLKETETANLNKNLAIANRSRVSCAHNTLRASIGLNIIP